MQQGSILDSGSLVVNSASELLENLPDPFAAIDPEWRITHVNRRAEAILGGTRDDLIGRSVWQLFPQVLGTRLELELRRAMQRRETVEFEELAPSGRMWLLVRAYPVSRGIGIQFRDVTAQRHAEQAERQQSQMMRLLQLAAVAANELSEPLDAFEEVVRRICEVTEWEVGSVFLPASEAGGELELHEFWCHQGPAETLARFRELTARTRYRPGVGLPGRVLASGKPAWIRDIPSDVSSPRASAAREVGLRSAVALPVQAGQEIVAVLEFFSREELEPDLLLLRTLETIGVQLGRVVERHRAERMIRQAKEEAETSSRAKTDFLSRMSHELRTPLNAILGFAQLLELDPLAREQRESVEQILKGGKHLLLLINEVLDIARIESGRLALSAEPVELSDVLEQSLALVAPLAADRSIRLSPAPPCDGHYVLADRQRLNQVVLNLLSNAIKYNRSGGRVTVGVTETDAGYRISIGDEGPGIAADRRERLFRPFERLDGAQLVEGTGLGLALSKAFVELMEGRIGFDCPEQGGSVFWVELRGAESQLARYEQDAASDASVAEPVDFGRHAVLYIEDNLSNVKLVQRVLSRRPGVEIIAAMQGSIGLELALRHRPSLILLDLNLPDLSGEEVLLRLKSDPTSADIPVVIVSADATPGQIELLRSTGAYEYLTKPLDVKRFLGVLDRVLQEAASSP